MKRPTLTLPRHLDINADDAMAVREGDIFPIDNALCRGDFASLAHMQRTKRLNAKRFASSRAEALFVRPNGPL